MLLTINLVFSISFLFAVEVLEEKNNPNTQSTAAESNTAAELNTVSMQLGYALNVKYVDTKIYFIYRSNCFLYI